MLGGGEDPVGAGERDDAERIRIGDNSPRWPLGNQDRGAGNMVVAAQEAQIDSEILDQLTQQLLVAECKEAAVTPIRCEPVEVTSSSRLTLVRRVDGTG